MLDLRYTEDWSTNWATLDRFVSDWLCTDFSRNSYSAEVAAFKQVADISLPPSALEWCAFALAARSLVHFSWRDCLVVEPVPGHQAISLLIQGEADYYWAIERECVAHPDPPVIGYTLNYDTEESTFERAGVWAPRVSAFALDYFLSYLQSPGGGFAVRQSSPNFHREDLLADFGNPSQFGHLELFHSDGVLVVLGGMPPSWRHDVISVEVQTQRPFSQLPSSIRHLVKDATLTHGGMHNYL